MSGATDSGMVKTMGLVMGALLVFAIICAVAARMLSGASDDPNDSLMREALMERLKPVASVRTSADDLPAASQGLINSAAADGPKTGEELVAGACAACHLAGAANAPKLDDEAAWAERREAGLDALVASVINGKGSMPARGGSAYTDDEIRLAVQNIALFEVDETSAAAAESEVTESTQSDTDATGEETSQTEQISDENEDTATAAAEQLQTEAEPADADVSATSESGQVNTETAVAATAALAVGVVPEGLTDNIKAQVDGVCAGCHISGIAEAPKIGDKEAWQVRADKGLDALTHSVINGLNVMPPRGGSTLTDEEVPIAVQYLMSK